MPFNTRSQLKTAVINLARRGDTATYFDDALLLAENRISQDLSTWSGEKSTSVSYLANATEVSLPSDLLELISASISTFALPEIEIVSPKKRVEILAGVDDGWPYPRASLEEGKLKFVRAFKTAGSVTFLYKASVTPLAAEGDTNWVLQRYYSLYLYAIMIELAIIWGAGDKLTTYTTAYVEALKTANRQQIYKGTNAFAEVDGVV
jgi:hypothetical protein